MNYKLILATRPRLHEASCNKQISDPFTSVEHYALVQYLRQFLVKSDLVWPNMIEISPLDIPFVTTYATRFHLNVDVLTNQRQLRIKQWSTNFDARHHKNKLYRCRQKYDDSSWNKKSEVWIVTYGSIIIKHKLDIRYSSSHWGIWICPAQKKWTI